MLNRTEFVAEPLCAPLSDAFLMLHLHQMSGCQKCPPGSSQTPGESSSDLELPGNELGLRLKRPGSGGFN